MITKKLENDLRSFGYLQQEIDKMTPQEAWGLLQQAQVKEEIKEPNKEKVYTLEELENEYEVLKTLWNDAFNRMYETSEYNRVDLVYSITNEDQFEHQKDEDYLKNNKKTLTAEEQYFIQISINMKKFRKLAKKLLYGDEGITEVPIVK